MNPLQFLLDAWNGSWTQKLYASALVSISTFLACYTDLVPALCFFVLMTIIDTVSKIDAHAHNKGLKFNPLKRYFWREIKSGGMRQWCKKVLWDYGRYALIAFALNEWVLKRMIILEVMDRKLELPVVAIYLFGGIEMWSIGENIEEGGGPKNLFKRVTQFLPEKVQQIFTKEDNPIV